MPYDEAYFNGWRSAVLRMHRKRFSLWHLSVRCECGQGLPCGVLADALVSLSKQEGPRT
jgi:hypothetical protein